MIIIIGDSRVKQVELAFSQQQKRAMEPICLVKPGAKMETILEMLKVFKQERRGIPLMVVVVGFLGDVLRKKEQKGFSTFQLNRERVYSNSYPAAEIIQEKRNNVDEEIRRLWPGTRIIWVLPYPLDFGRYERSHAADTISWSWENHANRQSLAFNDYNFMVDIVFQGNGSQDAIPWFPIWKLLLSGLESIDFIGSCKTYDWNVKHLICIRKRLLMDFTQVLDWLKV